MSAPTTVRSDEDIQRDVLEELAWEAEVQPNEIGVAVNDGIVTLTGLVDSFAKKWAAERAAQRVHGVVAVANDIEVRPARLRPSGPTPTSLRPRPGRWTGTRWSHRAASR